MADVAGAGDLHRTNRFPTRRDLDILALSPPVRDAWDAAAEAKEMTLDEFLDDFDLVLRDALARPEEYPWIVPLMEQAAADSRARSN
jgi:hypothetical protein